MYRTLLDRFPDTFQIVRHPVFDQLVLLIRKPAEHVIRQLLIRVPLSTHANPESSKTPTDTGCDILYAIVTSISGSDTQFCIPERYRDVITDTNQSRSG